MEQSIEILNAELALVRSQLASLQAKLYKLENVQKREDRMKEIGEMASLIAHEIRNPLGGIRGFAALLVKDLANLPKQREMAEFIVQGADDLNRVLTEVLDFSRPPEINIEKVELKGLCQIVVASIETDLAAKKGIRLTLNLPKDPILLSTDIRLVKGALYNLLLNAVQASGEVGEISLSLKEEREEVIFQVTDQGEGISARDLERIFKPFFTTKVGGHGLGLSEVRRTIEALGGHVTVSSKEGEGSKFAIHLPREHAD